MPCSSLPVLLECGFLLACLSLSLRCGPRVIILWWVLRLLLCMRGVRSHNSSTQFQTRMFPCQLDWIHHRFGETVLLPSLQLCWCLLVPCGRSRQDYWRQEVERNGERNGDIQRGPGVIMIRLQTPSAARDHLLTSYCPRDRDCDLLDTAAALQSRDNSQSRFHVQVSGSQRWCECFVSLSDNSDLVLLNNFHYLVRCHFQWVPIESWKHHQHQLHFLMLLNCCTVSRFPSWKPCSNRMVWNYWQSLTTTVKIWRARPHPSRQYFSQSVFQRWTATLGINKITILWFIFFDWMVLQWNIGENFKQLNWH